MLSTCSYSLLCNIIYIFKIDCNFFSTLGAAGGLFFGLNRPTAAAKRVYSTTHTRKHNLFLPVSPEVAVSKACAVITVSSLQAQKNVTAWAPELPVPHSISAQLHDAPWNLKWKPWIHGQKYKLPTGSFCGSYWSSLLAHRRLPTFSFCPG